MTRTRASRPPLPSEPRRIVAVAAYAENRVIGDHGRIPWRIPDDFAHFKAETLGHTLLMGRLTYDSIGRPLPGRRTVVVTRNRAWSADGVDVVHSLDEALSLAAALPGDTVIAGGTQVYEQAMPLLTHQVLTEVHLTVDGDARYPEFDLTQWRETRRVSRPDLDWVWWERVTFGG
jgi:dihydrofolate reductase